LIGLAPEIVLVAEDDEHLHESRLRLARVGMERVTGYLAEGIAGWSRAGMPVRQTPQISVEQLHDALEHEPDGLQVVDVRRPAEWNEGHIAQAVLKPLNQLGALMDDLDRTRPVAVHCKSGYRSSIATSLLERAGFAHVMNVTGGFDAWKACGLRVASGATASS